MNLIKEDYIFTSELHNIFMDSSNDYNPIHSDTSFIKNTSLKDINIHGTHIILKVLDTLLKYDITVLEMSVRFISSIYRNESVHLSIDLENKIVLISSNDKLCVKINYTIDKKSTRRTPTIEYDKPKYSQSRLLSFDDVSTMKDQKFQIIKSSSDLDSLYPAIIRIYHESFISELCSISYLIGMECPGFHSIEGGISLRFYTKERSSISPKFNVLFADERFDYIVIMIESLTFSAKVDVIYRR